MRYAGAVLSSAALFASCTCQKQVSPPPALREPRSGFHATVPTASPERAGAPAATPVPPAPPEQVTEAPTPAAEIPRDFPPDVPIFKGASVAQVQELANNARNVIFHTAAPLAAISAFYHERMLQQGWKTTQEFTRERHAFVSFAKGNMIANVTIAEDIRNPGRQIIAIMYEEQRELDFDEF